MSREDNLKYGNRKISRLNSNLMNSIGLVPIRRLGSACITLWIAWDKTFLWDSQPQIYLGFERKGMYYVEGSLHSFSQAEGNKIQAVWIIRKKIGSFIIVLFFTSVPHSLWHCFLTFLSRSRKDHAQKSHQPDNAKGILYKQT